MAGDVLFDQGSVTARRKSGSELVVVELEPGTGAMTSAWLIPVDESVLVHDVEASGEELVVMGEKGEMTGSDEFIVIETTRRAVTHTTTYPSGSGGDTQSTRLRDGRICVADVAVGPVRIGDARADALHRMLGYIACAGASAGGQKPRRAARNRP